MMPPSFDPYHKWLGIAPKEQPPNHYRLLALDLFESDPDVIDAAANRQMSYLQQRASGANAAMAQQLLNAVSAARLVLLDAKKKAAYDAELKIKKAETLEHETQPKDEPRNFPQPPRATETNQAIATNTTPRPPVKVTWAPAKKETTTNRQLRIVVVSVISGLIPVLFFWFYISSDRTSEDIGKENQHRVTLVSTSQQKTASDEKERSNASTTRTVVPKENEFSAANSRSEKHLAPPTERLSGVSAVTGSLDNQDINMPPRKPISATPLADQGVVELNGRHYYRLFFKKTSWLEAKFECLRMKGQLACIHDAEEQRFLDNLIGSGLCMWTGAYRNDRGLWVWLDGTSYNLGNVRGESIPFKYDYVAFHQILGLHARPRAGNCDDYPAKDVHGFICEWDSLANVKAGLQMELRPTNGAVTNGPTTNSGTKYDSTTSADSAASSTQISLFNGRDLDGWSVMYLDYSKKRANSSWQVDERRKVLFSSGGDWNDLRSNRIFKNFSLALEWRFTPNGSVSPNGSGIIVRSTGSLVKGLDPQGIEVDLRPSSNESKNAGTGCFIVYGTTLRNHTGIADGSPNRHLGWLREPNVKSSGDWNYCEIVCEDDRITVRMNGRLVNEGWGAEVVAGHICLRNQNTAVEFRDIRLRSVPRTWKTVNGYPSIAGVWRMRSGGNTVYIVQSGDKITATFGPKDKPVWRMECRVTMDGKMNGTWTHSDQSRKPKSCAATLSSDGLDLCLEMTSERDIQQFRWGRELGN